MSWKIRIQIVNDDVIGIAAKIGYEKYDTVTCNPPYFPAHEASEKNLLEHVAIARHEIHLTLDQAIQSASELLKQGGKAAFVHRPGRLLDIVTAMRANRLEPKRIRFVYPKEGKEANTLLIEGIKDGKPDLKILPPLYVYGADGEYTEEVRQLLYGKNELNIYFMYWNVKMVLITRAIRMIWKSASVYIMKEKVQNTHAQKAQSAAFTMKALKRNGKRCKQNIV